MKWITSTLSWYVLCGGVVRVFDRGGGGFPVDIFRLPPPFEQGKTVFLCKNFFKMMIVRRRGVLPPTFSGNSNVLLLCLFLNFNLCINGIFKFLSHLWFTFFRMSKKTQKNSGSLIRDFLGEPGKEWLPSELPTLRNVLLYMQFIKELSKQDARTVKDLVKEIFSFANVLILP